MQIAEWNVKCYCITESGTYNIDFNDEMLPNVATLNLTINYSSSSSEDITACDVYHWNELHILRVVRIPLSLLMTRDVLMLLH